jgi:hypothetical protein
LQPERLYHLVRGWRMDICSRCKQELPADKRFRVFNPDLYDPRLAYDEQKMEHFSPGGRCPSVEEQERGMKEQMVYEGRLWEIKNGMTTWRRAYNKRIE